MARHCQVLVALLAALAAADTSYNSWMNARGGIVRDTFYIEGGIYYTVASGSLGIAVPGGGGLTSYNLTTAFNSTSNFTSLFSFTDDLADPSARPHYSGGMVADDYEWYAYGGAAYPAPDNHSVLTNILRDGLYQPNSAATGAHYGITPDFTPQLGNSSNNHITNGGGVSAPSESLGFYFSGLESPAGSDISILLSNVNETNFPSVLVNSMLRIDTSQFGNSAWSQLPLPSSVTPRAEAALAWLPVGARGAVVVMGGVPFPASLTSDCNVQSFSQASNNSKAPDFMSTVSVYDVATGAWYNQETSGDPPQLAQACAVVASSADSTVHNIYVYGGYNGINSDATNDDVWVLSIPSFTWIKVAAGTTAHARYGHVCAKPYPDQMMIVGGGYKCAQPLITPQFADVFNLSSLSWTGAYDPSKWSEYVVPTTISNAIASSPTASMSAGLSGLVTAAYAGKLTHWYPYGNSSTNGGSSGPSSSPSHPKWVVPVAVTIGVIAGLIIIITTAFCCLYKRKGSSGSASGRGERRSWIDKWRRHPHTAQSVPDSEMTLNTEPRPGTHEIASYYDTKEGIVRGRVAELTATSSGMNSPAPSSAVHSPGIASLSSPRSELHSPPVRHELPADVSSISSSSHNIKNYHMYPHNIDGNASSVGPTATAESVSSPASAPAMTPLELPQTRDDEDVNNFNLNSSGALAGRALKSPRMRAAPIAEESDVSPNLTATDGSPDHGPTRMPLTPPFQPMVSERNKSSHARNASSISSSMPDVPQFSPTEEHRRSMFIEGLPDSPAAGSRPDVGSSRHAEASSDGDPNSPVPQRSPVLGMNSEVYATATQQIRRKKLQDWAPGKQNDNDISAYTENNKNNTGKGDTL